MSPAWLTPSPIPPLAMSPVDNFGRSPLTTVVVPERKLFELAEKRRPIPPTRPAKNASIVKLPSRLTTRPRPPVLPPNALRPVNQLSDWQPHSCGTVISSRFTHHFSEDSSPHI